MFPLVVNLKREGCSYEKLVIHLSQFTDGMDWSNWSRDGWH